MFLIYIEIKIVLNFNRCKDVLSMIIWYSPTYNFRLVNSVYVLLQEPREFQ